MTFAKASFFLYLMVEFVSLRFILLIVLLCSVKLSAQKVFPLDSLYFSDVKGFSADDYGSIYLYKNKNFSLTKFDSLGKQQGRLMLTLPFKVQDVQNPLNIVLFSENAQQMKFVDHNLNEIQKLDLRKFGFIKMAFAEDLQQIWLLDESMKRLIQYNFREDKIINSFPLDFSLEEVGDMHVFGKKLYILTDKSFSIYNFKSEKLFETPITAARKLRRENEILYVLGQNSAWKFSTSDSFKKTFSGNNSEIVDKNNSAYFELKVGKLYLYQLENK